MVEKARDHLKKFGPKLLDVSKRVRPALDKGSYLEAIALETLCLSGYVWALINVHIEQERGIGFDSLPEKTRSILLNLNQYNENEIFRWALILGVINEDMYKKLRRFYKKRNEAFHWFLTTDGTYEELEAVAEEGYGLMAQVIEEWKK